MQYTKHLWCMTNDFEKLTLVLCFLFLFHPFWLLFRLLSEGCDVNQTHPLGWTALHVAAMNDSIRLAGLENF